MVGIATLNVRLPESLKRHGGQVLERAGVSTSDAVRGMYEYMAREQKVPDFVVAASGGTDEKRRALRRLVGVASLPSDFDVKAAYGTHLLEKNAPGVRA